MPSSTEDPKQEAPKEEVSKEEKEKQKDPLHFTILNFLDSALQVMFAWHIYAIFDSPIMGILAFGVAMFLDVEYVLKRHPELEQQTDLALSNGKFDEFKETLHAMLPEVAFLNLVLFVLARLWYIFG